MSDDHAKRTVEMVTRKILEAAKHFREKAAAALADGQISQAEFDEAVRQSDEHAGASAAWWLTGEGPPP